MSSTKFKVGDRVSYRNGVGEYKVIGREGSRIVITTDDGRADGLISATFEVQPTNLALLPSESQEKASSSTERASKHDSAKADLSLIPPEALQAAARALMVGEKKYGRYNYYKGHKVSQLIAAMMRHATAFMDGEENDPTDGQPHLGSVIACAAMILKQQALGTSIDDRYKTEVKNEDDKK